MGFVGAAREWKRGGGEGGGGKKALLPKICYSYPAMMKLNTVIPYLKMIQRKKKMNESLKIVLINMITILMISAKMATLSLLKIKMF